MKKILVIEDDDIALELIRKTLDRKGYSVSVACNGIEGYDIALNERPTLIITDIAMPGADGVHLIRRVRDEQSLSSTPILVITGYGAGTATFAMAQGGTAYEPKPLRAQGLLDTVERLIGKPEDTGEH
jgi:two-component system cell cycle response regulator DivK